MLPGSLVVRPPETSASSRLSRMQRLQKSAQSLLSDLTTVPEPPAAVSGGDTASLTWSGGPEGRDVMTALVVVLLLGVTGLVALLLWRRRFTIPSGPTGLSGVSMDLRGVRLRSRDDVVHAFHQLALHSVGLVQVWWTHRLVASQLSVLTPAIQPAVQTLADVYEQARYLPPDVELPADRIRQAQAALEQCAACSN